MSGIWSILSVSSLLPMAAMAADKTAADYFVHSLPGAPEGPLLKMHAGLVHTDVQLIDLMEELVG